MNNNVTPIDDYKVTESMGVQKLIWSQNNTGCLLVGSPRSGTFLLMAILEECFNIAAPLETHFIPYFERYRYLWGDLKKVENRRKMLIAIFDFLDIWTPRMMVKGDLATAWKFSLSSVRSFSDQIVERSNSYGDLIANLFLAYQLCHNKSGWIDKSAYYKHVDIDLICKSMPQTKVIHLVRDGRDVVLSWMKTWATPTSLEEGAYIWNEHVLKKSTWGSSHADRYLEIRYEDLLSDTPNILMQIGDFLGIKPTTLEPNLGSSQYAQALSELDSHRLVAGGIRSDNERKFLKELNKKEISSFESIARTGLEKNNYSLESDAVPKPRVYVLLVLARAALSINSVKRFLKANLPLYIRISQLLKIDLARIVNSCGRASSWPRHY